MAYTGFELKGINMITKLQGPYLENPFMCKSETSSRRVRQTSQ